MELILSTSFGMIERRLEHPGRGERVSLAEIHHEFWD